MLYFSIRQYEEKYDDIVGIQTHIAELVSAAQSNRLLSRYNRFIVHAADDFVYFVQHPEELYIGLDMDKVASINEYKQTLILHALLAIIADIKPGDNVALPIYTNTDLDLRRSSMTQLTHVTPLQQIIAQLNYPTYYSYLIPFILRTLYFFPTYYTIFILHYDHFINEHSIYFNFLSEYSDMIGSSLIAMNILEEDFPRIKNLSISASKLFSTFYDEYLTKTQTRYLDVSHLSNFATLYLYIYVKEGNSVSNKIAIFQLGMANKYDDMPSIGRLKNYANANAIIRRIKRARRASVNQNMSELTYITLPPNDNSINESMPNDNSINESMPNDNSINENSTNKDGINESLDYKWDILLRANEGIIVENIDGDGIINPIVLLQIAKYGLYISKDMFHILLSRGGNVNTASTLSVNLACLLQMGYDWHIITTIYEREANSYLGNPMIWASILTGIIEQWPTQNISYRHNYIQVTTINRIIPDAVGVLYERVNYDDGYSTQLGYAEQHSDRYAAVSHVGLISNKQIINDYQMASMTIVQYKRGIISIKDLATNNDELERQLSFLLSKIYPDNILQRFMFNTYTTHLMVELESYYDYTLNNQELCKKYNIANIYSREQIMMIINDIYNNHNRLASNSHEKKNYNIQYYRRADHQTGDHKLHFVIIADDITLKMNDHLKSLLNYPTHGDDEYDDDYDDEYDVPGSRHILFDINVLNLIDAFDLWNAEKLQQFNLHTSININI